MFHQPLFRLFIFETQIDRYTRWIQMEQAWMKSLFGHFGIHTIREQGKFYTFHQSFRSRIVDDLEIVSTSFSCGFSNLVWSTRIECCTNMQLQHLLHSIKNTSCVLTYMLFLSTLLICPFWLWHDQIIDCESVDAKSIYTKDILWHESPGPRNTGSKITLNEPYFWTQVWTWVCF
jgi:hypothetical protein